MQKLIQHSGGTQHADGQTRQEFRLHFTGDGLGYARIWALNMVLTVLTLGIYLPWARVRVTRYFLGHTEIAGHPLVYDAQPRQMLRGTLLGAVLVTGGYVAWQTSGAGALLTTGVAVALGAALVHSGWRFRCAHTSWRGLNFWFHADLADTYRAVAAPLLLLLLPQALLRLAEDGQPGLHEHRGLLAAVWGGSVLLFVLLLPWFAWRVRRLRHEATAWGDTRMRFTAPITDFYRVGLQVLCLVILVGACAVLVWFAGAPLRTSATASRVFAGLGGLLVALTLSVGIQAIWVCGIQNAAWRATGNSRLRFRSRLSGWRYAGHVLSGDALTLLTLGLYRPFAAVAMYRLRVQAIRLVSKEPLERLVARELHDLPHAAVRREAAGDGVLGHLGIDAPA